jgi:hypothetical protein
MLYAKYRSGTIKRHIAANGAYLPFIWIRSKDAVDFGQIKEWPNAEFVPSLEANERESHDIPGGGVANIWVPVLFYEHISREIPQDYQRTQTMGYIAISPGPDRVPLYEWRHNTALEYNGGFTDHFNSNSPDAIPGRYRYQQMGIIGYLLKDAAPGFEPLFIGFDYVERNHILTTNKQNPGNLKNFRYLGYVKSSSGGEYNGELTEYHYEHPQPKHRDNLYSTIYDKQITEPIPVPVPVQPTLPRTSSGTESAIGARPALPRKAHFLAREVIAGGDDNPLYEGGIALATFSLEHIHGVSPHSLTYAKQLFEFIEESEEQNYIVLLAGEGRHSGFLRRTRNYWHSASSWGASTDELVGVFLGLRYFLDATLQDAPEYYIRAKYLLKRIAVYISSHNWIYMDSRIASLESYLETIGNKKLFDKSIGTLIFQYPFSRVFKEYLDGNSYSGPDTVGELEAILSIIADKKVEGDYFEESLSDLAIGMAGLLMPGTHSEIYEEVINSAYPISRSEGHDPNKFSNHRMLLHTSWLVLDSRVVGADRKKTFARRLVRYIHRMWGGAPGFPGPARENLLFSIVAKRCFQLLSDEEIKDELDLPGPDWLQRNSVRKYKEEVDRVIKKYITDAQQTWQVNLPLGEPNWDPQAPGEWMPWMSGWPPLGFGRNHAWRYKDKNFRIWTRSSSLTPEKAFKNLGPYYTKQGQLNLEVILANLKKYARVGYKIDDPLYDRLFTHGSGLFFKIEAGGMDFMFMRMLLTHMGERARPSLPDKDTQYSILPWSGASPWVYPAH